MEAGFAIYAVFVMFEADVEGNVMGIENMAIQILANSNNITVDRRPRIAKSLLLVAAVAMTSLLGACSTSTSSSTYGALNLTASDTSPYSDPGSRAKDRAAALRVRPYSFNYDAIYAAGESDGIAVSRFEYSKMNKRHLRQVVRFYGPERPGTIVVDVSATQLYLVLPGGVAMRYGIAVGKEGFDWVGTAKMKRKVHWPTWTPPAEMVARSPSLQKFAGGMPGGTQNPLGARAMYLYKDGKDTLYRIHGTTKPFSIGKRASSGCFRMINQDVIDLYERVKPGADVLVRARLEYQPGDDI